MEAMAYQPATYQDILNLPDHLIGEIMDGELYALPRPGPQHSAAITVLSSDLRPMFRSGGGGLKGDWIILVEPELHLGSDIVVPDLAGWKRVRMPFLPRTAFTTLEPDWVCEVLSPATALLDRTVKKRTYANHRVEFLWLVDPILRTLEASRLSGAFWQEIGTWADAEKVRIAPFEALDLDLREWWEDVEPDLGQLERR